MFYYIDEKLNADKIREMAERQRNVNHDQVEIHDLIENKSVIADVIGTAMTDEMYYVCQVDRNIYLVDEGYNIFTKL